MDPTPIVDGSRGYTLEVDSLGRASTKTVLMSSDGNAAAVDSSGRLLTSALVPCVSKTVHTTLFSLGQNTVGTLGSRSDRCAMFFMNTGNVLVHFVIGAQNPTSSDLQLPVGEVFVMPFNTNSESRFVSFAGAWNLVAVEGAES